MEIAAKISRTYIRKTLPVFMADLKSLKKSDPVSELNIKSPSSTGNKDDLKLNYHP